MILPRPANVRTLPWKISTLTWGRGDKGLCLLNCHDLACTDNSPLTLGSPRHLLGPLRILLHNVTNAAEGAGSEHE